MKSILHLKDDTEYQIPLREKDDGTTVPNPEAEAKKETEVEVETAKEKTEEISQEEVNDKNDALEGLKEENPEGAQNQEHSSTKESNSDANTKSVPPAGTAKAALDEMKKLASQEGVIHPSLFISNFSKILGLMERAMQLQVKESGSATEEEASGATEEKTSKSTEQAETPAEG